MNSARVMVALQRGLLVWMDARGQVVYSSSALHWMKKYTFGFGFYVQYTKIYAHITSLYLPSLKPSYTREHKSSLWAPDHILYTCTISWLRGSQLGLSLATTAVRQGRNRQYRPWITDTLTKYPP